MGCWPYLTLLAQYVKEVSGFYSASSLGEMHRKLRWIGLELRRLKREKRIGTDNPAKMGKLDIMELLKSMKERDLSVNTVSKQITQLKYFLEWCGNPVIGNIQKLGAKQYRSSVSEDCLHCPATRLKEYSKPSTSCPDGEGGLPDSSWPHTYTAA